MAEGLRKCLSCGLIFYSAREDLSFNWFIFAFLLIFFWWFFFIPPILYGVLSHKIECPRCKSKKWRFATSAELEEAQTHTIIQKETIREIEVVYCSHCGIKNNARSTYCSQCGAPVH